MPNPPKRLTHKTGRPTRTALLSVPLTPGQKRAVIRAAEKLGLDPASFARMCILAQTPYDPERDEYLDAGPPEPRQLPAESER